MLILTIQELEDVIQKFLQDTDGTGVDLSSVYEAIDALEASLHEHETNQRLRSIQQNRFL